jgi:hypothetical protein
MQLAYLFWTAPTVELNSMRSLLVWQVSVWDKIRLYEEKGN